MKSFCQYCQKILAKEWAQVSLIVLLALILRLYKFNAPLADWHSFRQTDTASVSWEYYQTAKENGGKIDLLRPKYQDLSDTQSGLNNPEGWRMVEFPLINALVAKIMLTIGTDQVVAVYRSVNIFLSLISIIAIYFLTKKVSSSRSTALISAFTLATLPYAVFYSRSILPEVALITGQILTLLFFYNYLHTQIKWQKILFFFLTIIILATTLLIKPVAVFLAPVLIYLVLNKYQSKFWQAWPLYLIAVLSTIPLLLWRQWILNFPSGVPASAWLLQGSVKAFSYTWFRWLFVERFVKMILGFFGTILITVSLCKKNISQNKFFNGFLIVYAFGMALFLIVFASGNIQHDYYQCFILPFLAIGLGKAINYCFEQFKILPFSKASKNNFLNSMKIFFQEKIIIAAIVFALCFEFLLYFVYHDENSINLGQTIGWRLILLIILFTIITIFILSFDFLKTKINKSSVFYQVFQHKYFPLAMATFLLIGFIGDYFQLARRVSGFYNINHPEIVLAGERAQFILPRGEKVIAPYQGDTTFLFQTKHQGWSLGDDIADKISQGAQYYISVNQDDEAKDLASKYQVIEENPTYIIINLQAPK